MESNLLRGLIEDVGLLKREIAELRAKVGHSPRPTLPRKR